MEAAERAELEQMRSMIVRRLEELDARASYGEITARQRDEQLAQEFGPDYQDTLRGLNALLHTRGKRPTRRHAPLAALTVAAVLLLAFSASLLPLTGTGAFAAEISMRDGDLVRLDDADAFTLTDVRIDYDGEVPYVLFLHDGAQRHTIAEGDGATLRCTGCGKNYGPPYMLELSAPGGEMRVRLETSG